MKDLINLKYMNNTFTYECSTCGAEQCSANCVIDTIKNLPILQVEGDNEKKNV